MHGRNGTGSWSGKVAFIVTGTWFDDEDVVEAKEDERDGKGGREDVGSFLPLNSKVSTFQLGHVHLYPMGAYVCTDALGIQPSSPLLMEIEKYEVKITAPRNSRIRFLGNQILEANDRIVAILVRVLESCFRKWNSRFLVRFEFRNGWISSVELNKRIASSFFLFFVIGILLSKVKKSFFHFLKNYFPRI